MRIFDMDKQAQALFILFCVGGVNSATIAEYGGSVGYLLKDVP